MIMGTQHVLVAFPPRRYNQPRASKMKGVYKAEKAAEKQNGFDR